MKAFEQPYSAEMINLRNHANKLQEADFLSTDGVTDNVPSTPHIGSSCWKDQNCIKIINSESPASVVALSKSNGSCPENHGPTPAYSRHQFPAANGSRMHPLENTISSCGGSSSQAGQAVVSGDASDNIGSILGELEQAKLSINQQINVSPIATGRSSIKHSILPTRIEDKFDIPSAFPGLFRLPTDFQLEATTTPGYKGFPSRFSSANHFHETGYDQFSTTPNMESGSNAITGLPHSTGFNYLNPPSSFGHPFSSKPAYPTYPFRPSTTTTTSQLQANWSPLYESSPTTFCPTVVPKLSSGEEVLLRSLPMNETGLLPSFPVTHHDALLRPNMYR